MHFCMTSLDNYTSCLGELKKFQRLSLYSSEHLLLQTLQKNKTRLDLRIEIFIHASSFQPEAETQVQSLPTVLKEVELKESTTMAA